jgi:hypothetical protein
MKRSSRDSRMIASMFGDSCFVFRMNNSVYLGSAMASPVPVTLPKYIVSKSL